MKTLIITIIGSVLMLFAACGTKSLLVTDQDHLANNRILISQGDEWLNSNLTKLTEKADQIVEQPIYLITEKDILPDSKNRQDYYSIATYYWPNPDTKDGRPYIHKDGQPNPDRLKIKDYSYLLRLWREMRTLSLAYFYTQEERYATKANQLLHSWFIDSKTSMNPNLNHAQAIPGRNSGRVEGIIDSRVFVDITDAIELFKQSEALAQEDYDALKDWFSNYLDWLTDSQLGKQAYILKNNIGTAYAMQVIGLSIFTGRNNQAVGYLESQIPTLLDGQLETDGRQPLELRRTRGWDYSISNLSYWFKIASMAERLNYDLWNYVTPSGKSIGTAYRYLGRFASGEEEWEAKQIADVDMTESFLTLELVGQDKFTETQSLRRSSKPSRSILRNQTSRSMNSRTDTLNARSSNLRERQRTSSLSPEAVLSSRY